MLIFNKLYGSQLSRFFCFIVYIDIRDHCIPAVRMQLFILGIDWRTAWRQKRDSFVKKKERDEDLKKWFGDQAHPKIRHVLTLVQL